MPLVISTFFTYLSFILYVCDGVGGKERCVCTGGGEGHCFTKIALLGYSKLADIGRWLFFER